MVSALTQAGWHVRCAHRSVGPTSSTADIVTGPLLEYQSKIKPSPDLLPDAAVAFLNEIPRSFRTYPAASGVFSRRFQPDRG
jgi:hypothetical protein